MRNAQARRISVPKRRLLAAMTETTVEAPNSTDLAAVARTSHDAMNTHLEELEEEGLIRQHRGRGSETTVELTPAGRQMVEKVQELQRDLCEQATSTLSDAEQKQLLELLQRLNVAPWLDAESVRQD